MTFIVFVFLNWEDILQSIKNNVSEDSKILSESLLNSGLTIYEIFHQTKIKESKVLAIRLASFTGFSKAPLS